MVWGDGCRIGLQAINHPTSSLNSPSSQEAVVLSTPADADSIEDDWTPLKMGRREEEQRLNYLKQMEEEKKRKEAAQQAEEERRGG